MSSLNEAEQFFGQFVFSQQYVNCVGTEREGLLVGPSGMPVPWADRFLALLPQDEIWTYELSRCQVENRTLPLADSSTLLRYLRSNDLQGDVTAARIGVKILRAEVATESMPLDVYPVERYANMAEVLGEDRLRAACRVMGTHIHVGCANWEEAIERYNLLRAELPLFCRMGDHSLGERLRLYGVMVPNAEPPELVSKQELFEVARSGGFLKNPRNCHHLIRISRYGTVEVRAFGIGEPEEVMEWVVAVCAVAGVKWN